MRHLLKVLFVAVGLTLTSVPELNADVITMTDKDLMGGGISRHYNIVQELNKQGHTVRLDARNIVSAGTFYLMVKGSCIVDPNTNVEFHGPQSALGTIFTALTAIPVNGAWMPEEKAEWIRRQIQDFYNSEYPGLGDWFYLKAAHKGGMFVTRVKAHELSRVFGVRICITNFQ